MELRELQIKNFFEEKRAQFEALQRELQMGRFSVTIETSHSVILVAPDKSANVIWKKLQEERSPPLPKYKDPLAKYRLDRQERLLAKERMQKN